MSDKKKLSRRSFLRNVSGAAVAFGAVGAVTGSAKAATDSDPNDAVGRGYNGVSDSDGGSNADRAGRGRVATGVTDSDSADAGGRGRGSSGITDSDTGSYADPAGNGRGNSGVTDSDTGNYADPAGRGRR